MVLASAAIAGSLPRSETVAPRPAANEVGLGFELIRPEDQLAFRVHRSFGFETVPKGGGYVLRATTDSASIEIQLPPQHVLEWFVNGRPNLPVHTAWPLLRFHIPAGTEIPLSTAGFLAAMRDMELLTHSLAGAVDLVEAPSGQAVHVPTADLLRADDAYLVDGQRRGAAQSTEAAALIPVEAQSMVIRYADTFATHGFDTTLNPGEVVFALSGALPVRVMDAAAAGGLFNELDLSILGTSRKFGPVAGSPRTSPVPSGPSRPAPSIPRRFWATRFSTS